MRRHGAGSGPCRALRGRARVARRGVIAAQVEVQVGARVGARRDMSGRVEANRSNGRMRGCPASHRSGERMFTRDRQSGDRVRRDVRKGGPSRQRSRDDVGRLRRPSGRLTGLTGALRGIVAHRIVAAYRAASRRHAYDPARIVVACRFHASKSSPPSSTSASACVREPKSTPRAFSHAASLRGSAAR
ncbi:hypothetical protein X961_5681 [Burkholderia pseudomallei MSHR5613]|nr:hypothetical protein X961_5681 [Burkholderia pseudomallei MSHR5613]